MTCNTRSVEEARHQWKPQGNLRICWLRGGSRGQADRKAAALAGRAVDRDGATHCFGELFDEGEPQTGTAATAVFGAAAEEWLEHVGEILWSDAIASVADRELDHAVFGGNGGRDETAGRSVTDRVADQIAHDLIQALRVSQGERGLGRNFGDDLHTTLTPGEWGGELYQTAGSGTHVDRFRTECQTADGRSR